MDYFTKVIIITHWFIKTFVLGFEKFTFISGSISLHLNKGMCNKMIIFVISLLQYFISSIFSFNFSLVKGGNF